MDRILFKGDKKKSRTNRQISKKLCESSYRKFMFAQIEIHTPFLLKKLKKLLLLVIEFALNQKERYQELRNVNVTLYVN